MNKKQAWKLYKEYRDNLAVYQLALTTAYFDKETIAPLAGNAYRNSKLAKLSGVLFSLETDPKAIENIKYLAKETKNKLIKREIALANKNLAAISTFSKEETMEWELLCAESFDAWYQAKNQADYSLFAPYLNKLINGSIERAKRRRPEMIPYDVVLDDFEEGLNIETYDRFFNLIKKELLPLIQRVKEKEEAVDDSFLYAYYPLAKQEQFSEILLDYLGFDKKWGYLGISEHPFTSGFSRNDVRITTSYDEHNIASSIFSIIHEVGHAYYEHQVDGKYDDLLIRSQISSGMHESQSRFLENYIGKRYAFWTKLYPKLQALFPENLANVTQEQFVRAINASRPSLIRTEADELTYPIHILIRYELEKELFNGELDLNELSTLWNQKYQTYLGISAQNDRDGILQDIHWSSAAFGYFPTYALGSAVAAQLFNKLNTELAVDELLAKGQFKQLEKWLKAKVQHDGALLPLNEVLLRATGENFNPEYYIHYLKKKYEELYQL